MTGFFMHVGAPHRSLTSGTVVSYGVLMNFGALSLMSDTLTITGIVRFLLVDFTVQLSWKTNDTRPRERTQKVRARERH